MCSPADTDWYEVTVVATGTFIYMCLSGVGYRFEEGHFYQLWAHRRYPQFYFSGPHADTKRLPVKYAKELTHDRV